MNYRPLGNTGLSISELTLGTVELGLDYGFKHSDHYRRPQPQEAIAVIQRAVDLGINLIDTARNYGESESLIGRALSTLPGQRPYVATKVYLPDDELFDSKKIRSAISRSIETSLKHLRTEVIDILQIHNTTLEVLHSDVVREALADAQRRGMVRFLGASSSARGDQVPLAMIKEGTIPIIQAPFNLLDQVLTKRLFPEAAKQGIGILTRSAFLRGVLTNQVVSIPDRLAPLREAARRALVIIGSETAGLAEAALRFNLSYAEVSSVIIGVRAMSELEENVKAADKGPFSTELVSRLRDIAIEDQSLIDTTQWKDLTI
jgi:aryl-alcohol dehydrogenase-like predicted oxidoreductase